MSGNKWYFSAFLTTFSTVFTLILTGLLILNAMLYFNQEELIFFPTKLPANHQFRFNTTFQERYISTPDGHRLHGLLFKADAPQGLIFYLHGNTGGLEAWGELADTYTSLNYDVFMLDYRGFGKSEGRITSEKQFHEDVQLAYNHVRLEYPESKIVVLGYSVGSAPATRLAAHNQPNLLILQAPYYSIVDMAQRLYPMIPAAIIKYKFKTYEFVEKTAAPIVLIHGDKDEVIYPGSSIKLKEHLKPGDKLFMLQGQLHNGFTENPEYIKLLQNLLHASRQNSPSSLQLEEG